MPSRNTPPQQTKHTELVPQPANEVLRRPEPNVIDQRQQQIDPAGRHRVDVNAPATETMKQPGDEDHESGGDSTPDPARRESKQGPRERVGGVGAKRPDS